LAGVLPIGVFLVVHLLTNERALFGQASYERGQAMWEGGPALVLEAALVLVPLAFHALYGAYLMVTTKSLPDSPYAANWRVLVRASAWVALAFVGYHLYAMGRPYWQHAVDSRSLHTFVAAELSQASGGALVPWRALAYLVGLAATTLHFATGMWGYWVRTKRAVTPKDKRNVAILFGALGSALFGISSLTVLTFATGAPLFLGAPEPPPCPLPPLSAPSSPLVPAPSASATNAPAPPSADASAH
jgi:succinate dehydrogenase/fumarate reductase cytochrome b subunit